MNDKQFPKEAERLQWLDTFSAWRYLGRDCIEDAYYNPDDDGDPWNGAWVSLDPGLDTNEVEKEFRKLGCIVIYSTINGLVLDSNS